MLSRQTIFIFILILLMAGCATHDPVINTVIQEVKIPIAIPCSAIIPPSPKFNFDSIVITDNIYDKVKALLADRKIAKGYEIELSAALNSCVN